MYVRFLVFQKERLRKNVLGAYCIAALKLKVQTYRNRMYFFWTGIVCKAKFENRSYTNTPRPLYVLRTYTSTSCIRSYFALFICDKFDKLAPFQCENQSIMAMVNWSMDLKTIFFDFDFIWKCPLKRIVAINVDTFNSINLDSVRFNSQ